MVLSPAREHLSLFLEKTSISPNDQAPRADGSPVPLLQLRDLPPPHPLVLRGELGTLQGSLDGPHGSRELALQVADLLSASVVDAYVLPEPVLPRKASFSVTMSTGRVRSDASFTPAPPGSLVDPRATRMDHVHMRENGDRA